MAKLAPTTIRYRYAEATEEEETYYQKCHGAGCWVTAFHPYRSFYYCSKQCKENPERE